MEFINLYIQTEYSLLNSTIRLSNLIDKLANDKSSAAAICDDGAMYGAIKFYEGCLSKGIKPIFGVKVAVESLYGEPNYILLYAMNNEGYKNIMTISSVYKITSSPVNFEKLSQYSKGVLAILPDEENEIIGAFRNDDLSKFNSMYNQYKSIYENLYIGLSIQGTMKRPLINKFISNQQKYNFNLVALHRINFFNDDEYLAYQILRKVSSNNVDYEVPSDSVFYNYVSSVEGIREFNNYPELVLNTQKICDKCNVTIDFDGYKLPLYDSSLENPGKYLRDLCLFGLQKRLKNKNKAPNKSSKDYLNRLEYELEVINKMGFNDYFLIVYDFIKYAKQNGILVGPGRGSGSSSLVSYSLGITNVDPLEYNLLFERFLNVERITMPDIDTDFPDIKREQVIKYVGEKYGTNKVAHISTFGTYGPKGALRDACKYLRIPDLFLNEMLKYVGGRESINECLNVDIFQKMIKENNLIEVCQVVQVLEGIPRNLSVHPAGIIMTKDDLINYTPLQKGMNGLYQTQYDAKDLEKLGLLKMDFLGIRNLSIIDEVLKEIKANENIDVDLSKIPLDDPLVFKLIREGDTDGIFQLESSGMRSVLMRMKTNSFMDIVNTSALYRPGPMEMIPTFIARKLNQQKIDYIHPDLRPILESTYGIIVFQEQIMLIAQKFAGYSLGEADVLRRAVSKKKKETLEKEREKFVSCCIKNNYSEKVSNEIYDYIVKFANYGFNKCHSVVYSLVSYQMAYLKVHYYKYFMANMMSSSVNSSSLMKNYISSCSKKGINVLPPSINYSTTKCQVVGNSIYYPLTGISNVGAVTVTDLLNERSTQLFENYFDFVSRTKSIINKRIFMSLVASGALDEFGLTKKAMVEKYDEVLMRLQYQLLQEKLVDINFTNDEYSFDEVSQLEREALGLNIKYNMFKQFEPIRRKFNATTIGNISLGTSGTILCGIKDVREVTTKKNEVMAFISVFDECDTLDIVAFPLVYNKLRNIIVKGNIYVFKGQVEMRNEKKQMILENVFTLQ